LSKDIETISALHFFNPRQFLWAWNLLDFGPVQIYTVAVSCFFFLSVGSPEVIAGQHNANNKISDVSLVFISINIVFFCS
jgi:hypothetical protein